jgi:putative PEP-CTERM system TPR-repeat lipoprotein
MRVMRQSINAARRSGGRGLRALAFAVLCLIAACDAGEKVSFDELLARAQHYREAGEFRASLIELKNAVQKEPGNAEARLLLAQMELDLGDAVSAEIELQRARELGAPRDRVGLVLAEARLQLEQFDDMLRELRVEDDAASARQVAIFNLRGRAHLALGQAVLAEEAFKAALALDEKSVDALVGLTRLAYAKGDVAQSQNYLARATAAEPRNLVVLALHGDIAFAARDHEAAERHFREVLGQRKDDLAALNAQLGIARSQIATGRFTEAIALLGQVLRTAPGDPATNYMRALVAYQLQDYENARNHAELALRVAENHRPSQFIAGASNYALGRYEAALAQLKAYLLQVPGHQDARKLLAATQLRLGQSANAVNTLRPAADGANAEDAQLLAMIGTAAAQTGDFRSASRYLGRAVASEPDNPVLRARLGATQVALGNVAEGLSELEKAANADPQGNADVALILAHLRIREYDKALEAAQRLQAKQPASPNGYTLAGTAEVARGQMAAAKTAFNKALELRSGDRNAIRNLAAIAVAENALDVARGYYQDALRRAPNDEEFLILLAALEARSGRQQEGRALLEKAVAARPNSVAARIALGRHHLQAGEPGQALAAVQPALKDVREAAALEVVGRAHIALGQPDFAIAALRDLVSVRPESAEAHQYLANAYEDANLVDRAVAQTELALRFAKDSAALKFQYARLLARAGKLTRANQMLADLRRTHPNEPGLLDLEGSVALASDRIDDALAAYTRLLQAEETNANLLKLARVKAMRGREQEAYRDIEEWVARRPADVLVRTALADTYLARGEPARAASEYTRVVEAVPDNAMALNNLAWSLAKAGRAADAVRYAERAVALAPNSPPFLDTLGVALLAAGRGKDAIVPLRIAAERAPHDVNLQFHLAQALASDEQVREARDLLRLILRGRPQWPDRAEAEALLRRVGG